MSTVGVWYAGPDNKMLFCFLLLFVKQRLRRTLAPQRLMGF